jgi:hypothetical protein
MKITEKQLRQIIREERARMSEGWGYSSSPSGSSLMDFARAYSTLGEAVSSQVEAVVEAYLSAGGDIEDDNFVDVVFSQNPSALDLASERLMGALRQGNLGNEGQAVMDALTAAISLSSEQAI